MKFILIFSAILEASQGYRRRPTKSNQTKPYMSVGKGSPYHSEDKWLLKHEGKPATAPPQPIPSNLSMTVYFQTQPIQTYFLLPHTGPLPLHPTFFPRSYTLCGPHSSTGISAHIKLHYPENRALPGVPLVLW